MCVLSNQDIVRRIKEGSLVIEPFDVGSVGPDSVDFHLGRRFVVLEAKGRLSCVSLAEQDECFRGGQVADCTETVDADHYVIHPGKVVVARVQEYIKLPDDLAGRVDGRSKFAQLGLQVESAGLSHAGWEGWLVLELSNLSDVPLEVEMGLPICQVSFYPLTSPALSREELLVLWKGEGNG